MGKLLKVVLIGGLALTLAAGAFSAGFWAGHVTAVSQPGILPLLGGGVITEQSDSAGVPDDLRDEFAPFWEAWSLVHEEYIIQPVDDQALAYGAIKGMLQALGDRHTGYSTPAEAQIMFSDASGELEGIGAEVDISGDYVTIISPFPGSPAEKAGILPGDRIIEVDGEDMSGVEGMTVISKVRGPAGTKVVLTIVREGEAEPLTFEITRAKIDIPSVESKMLDDSVGYVKINSFGSKTTKELRQQLSAILANNPAGLVLDLRGNPGGYRDAAIDVVSQFIASGVVMTQESGSGEKEVFEATGDGLATEVPLVVLINQGSASASEIVAAAVQDYDRGTVIGEQSYGKGTVQDWRLLSGNNGAVRITVARWLSPAGRWIDGDGVTPDVEVPLTKAHREAQVDPQLEAAIALLLGK